MNKKIFLIVLIIVLTFIATAGAQTKTPNYKIVGNEIVKVTAVKESEPSTQTRLRHKIKDSVFVVWKSPRGAFYIWRTSKNTGKKYKQYLKLE